MTNNWLFVCIESASASPAELGSFALVSLASELGSFWALCMLIRIGFVWQFESRRLERLGSFGRCVSRCLIGFVWRLRLSEGEGDCVVVLGW